MEFLKECRTALNILLHEFHVSLRCTQQSYIYIYIYIYIYTYCIRHDEIGSIYVGWTRSTISRNLGRSFHHIHHNFGTKVWFITNLHAHTIMRRCIQAQNTVFLCTIYCMYISCAHYLRELLHIWWVLRILHYGYAKLHVHIVVQCAGPLQHLKSFSRSLLDITNKNQTIFKKFKLEEGGCRFLSTRSRFSARVRLSWFLKTGNWEEEGLGYKKFEVRTFFFSVTPCVVDSTPKGPYFLSRVCECVYVQVHYFLLPAELALRRLTQLINTNWAWCKHTHTIC